MITNRPDYAAQRRPGDPSDLTRSAWDLVAFHATIHDAETIAALIDAGAAALAHAPGHATDVVGLNARRRDITLGHAAADALRAEAERCHCRNQDRYVTTAKRDAKEARRLEREQGATP